MHFDWIYVFLFVAFLFIIGVFAGIAYAIMRFCNRWTRNHKYEVLFNTVIFILSFFLVSFISCYIIFSNASFQR